MASGKLASGNVANLNAVAFFALLLSGFFGQPANAAPNRHIPANQSSKKQSSNNKSRSSGAPQMRTLVFPGTAPLGHLMLLTEGRLLDKKVKDTSSDIGAAKGTVHITVPSGQIVGLEINRTVLNNPTCLNQVSEHGIEFFKSSFFSMEENDSEPVQCNKLLQYVPHLKDLKYVNVDRSDSSDIGVSNLAGMKNLVSISMFMTPIHGDCFKDFCTLPELCKISADICPIVDTNLSYLANIPKLNSLSFYKSRLTNGGIKRICKCRLLTNLKLAGNKKLDDDCLQYLATLRHLQTLDLRETAITLKGLEQLKGLPLKSIELPNARYGLGEIAQLQKCFPGANLVCRSESVDKDHKVIFAPLR